MPFVLGRIAILARTLTRSFPILVLLATLTALSACAPGANLPPLPNVTDTAYRLGPGDQVHVTTFGGEQLTGDFRVSDSGNVAVPLLGLVPASGRTTAELGDEIAARLRRMKLFTNPSVAVEVVSYRPIFVLGEVNHPGQYPYQPGMTVLSAVAVAGGFTYRAVTDYASIIRNINGRPVEGKVRRQTLMQPGDVLTIFERHF